ncbi:MAG: hypothetical protein IPK04_15620 [Bdellovibrionales bacterium]|nr:hypothetical protein [Bdellovibrionales bacterium]
MRKGVDPVSVKNNASFLFVFKFYDAITLEQGQRRFSVLQLTDTKLKESGFIKEWSSVPAFVAEIRSKENIEALARYLYFKTLEHDMISVFTSQRSAEVLEAGLTEWERWVVFLNGVKIDLMIITILKFFKVP